MGLIAGLAVFIAGILGAALARQFADEFKAWTPWAIERLVRNAVARLPENQRERFGEEWRSHLNEIPGEVGKLVVAFGFVFAARKMSSILKTGRDRTSVSDILKRTLDVTFSAACLFLCFPLLLVIGCLIRLESSGPVIFRQFRIGRNGRQFELYRFRTVSVNLEDAFPWRPRLTRIGRLLRRTALDELPVLLNVLRGEMSLVGPRPKTPNYVDSYHVPDHPEQATTKPGVTGWAQANGSSDPKTELANDLYYIKNRSLKLDLLILVRTIKRALARY